MKKTNILELVEELMQDGYSEESAWLQAGDYFGIYEPEEE